VPCGRVAAILNDAHNDYHQEKRGFFGFFESVDDPQVSAALFDAVRAWFAARGIKELRGPTNPSLNHECGLLIDGFQRPPTFMMTYNPPYYARLLEDYGFRKVQDLFAYYGTIDMLGKLNQKLAFIALESAERFHVRVRPLDKSRFRAEIELFLNIYNQSLRNTWGFVPISAPEIRHMSASLKHLILPDLALIAEVDGRAVGAIFGLPDYNPRIKEIDGRLFPFGIFKLLSRRKFQRFRVISANVLPEFQMWGIGLVLMKGLVQPVLDSGIQEAEFSWVLESNHLSRSGLEKGGALLEKTYRLYDYPA
jgi:GNAT superfamily N-acetyltransferase